MKSVFVLMFISAIVCLSAHAQTALQCPKNTEDMMNYFLMDYPDRTDHFMGSTSSNPIYGSIDPDIGAGYASQGTFVWTKSVDGYPWDVRTFDKNYIYDRSTELDWTDSTSFKRFSSDMRISPRCISTKSGSDTIKLSSKQSTYRFYTDCESTQTANLGYVTNVISAPTTVKAGGNLGSVKTRTLTYTYSCNSSYSNCLYKEVFSLGLNVGLYDWKYYIAKKGKWVLSQDSQINQFSLGQTVPLFSCPNTYK